MIQTTLRHWEYYGLTETFSDLYTKSSKGLNFKNIYEVIISEANILLAYRSIKANKGSTTAGTDKFNIGHYKTKSRQEFIEYIRKSLTNYKPRPVKRTLIPKANGKTRPLGIPCMIDRLIQQMFKQVLEPICEAKFYNHSYGFRPLRTAHHAIARTNFLINRGGYHYCVDIDIEGFFDNVNHTRLMKQLWNIGIHDKRVLAIIMKMLKAPIKGEGIPTKGTPQGGILSPLLSNVVLNDLDHWVSGQFENFHIEDAQKSKNPDKYKYKIIKEKTNLKAGFIVRYADDFKILAKDAKTAMKWFHAVTGYLNDRLVLNISKEKSGVVNLRKRSTEFLGFKLKLMKKGTKLVVKSNIKEQKLKQIKENAKTYIKQISKNPSKANVQKFNAFILGIHNYFKIATHVYKDLDKLAFDLKRLMNNRFRGIGKFKPPKNMSPLYKKRFGHLKRKIWIIKDTNIFPIVAQKHESPMNISQELTIFSEKGRSGFHKSISKDILMELSKMNTSKFHTYGMDYLDNKLSRYSMKKGLCEISGIFLTANEVHCHHYLPKSLGGNDNIDNLRIIHKDLHSLVHAKDINLINSIIAEFKLNFDQIAKINRYRKNCKLEEITR